MALLPLPPDRLARALRAVAALGLVASAVGLVGGWVLLDRTAAAIDASLALTEEALAAVDASAGIADEAVGSLASGLTALQRTAEGLDAAFDDAEVLTDDLAELVRGDVADSIGAIEGALPGLIDVAGTIDQTLGALSALPFGPAYDPDRSFRDSLLVLQTSLDGLPEELVRQAELIDATGGNLSEVGAGVAQLATELAAFDTTLQQTAGVLETTDAALDEGRAEVLAAGGDLTGALWLGRAGLVLLALAFAGLQLVPLQMAAMVDREVSRPGPRRTGASRSGRATAGRGARPRPRP